MKKLIIIDMQNDFVTGSLGSLDAQAIVPNVVARANEYEPEEIMFTADRHNDDYLNTLEGKKLPVKHCIMGTDGYKIIAPLEGFIQPNSREVFPKPTFGSTDLQGYLCALNSQEEIEELEFCGVCTDICVISNVLAARMVLPNTKITVRANCCAGVTPEKHEAALKAMESCQIDVIWD